MQKQGANRDAFASFALNDEEPFRYSLLVRAMLSTRFENASFCSQNLIGDLTGKERLQFAEQIHFIQISQDRPPGVGVRQHKLALDFWSIAPEQPSEHSLAYDLLASRKLVALFVRFATRSISNGRN